MAVKTLITLMSSMTRNYSVFNINSHPCTLAALDTMYDVLQSSKERQRDEGKDRLRYYSHICFASYLCIERDEVYKMGGWEIDGAEKSTILTLYFIRLEHNTQIHEVMTTCDSFVTLSMAQEDEHYPLNVLQTITLLSI